MQIGEVLKFSYQSLVANRLRTFLTALGLVIGNASVILVVTISQTSQEYVLNQIRSIGSNMVYANYEGGSHTAVEVTGDFIKTSDVEAVRARLGSEIVAATGVMTNYDRMRIGGREEDVSVIGVDEQYPVVRNLVLLAGRYIDAGDVSGRGKVCLLTQKLARRLYGSQPSSLGQTLKLHGLQFEVVGTFRERTASFGLSELSDEAILIPITVLTFFNPVERIDPLYVQARSAADVEPITQKVRQIIEARHRPGARYKVENLNAILDAAKSISLVLTLVLVLVSALALIISGIGIMNIMLVTVTERTREIGVRMAVGASRKEILQQFLAESVLISLGGGGAGILIGVALPLIVNYLAEGIQIPISKISIVVAFGVSFIVGLVFGLLPANRAARLNPTEALRYE